MMISHTLPGRLPTASCSGVGSSKSAFLRGARVCSGPCTAQSCRCHAFTVEARFRGRNTDMSKVPQFKRHEGDTGSPEYQVSVLSARIAQLSTHMISNRKDYSSRRGLEALLGRRRHFMQYLYRTDRPKYDNAISELKIRPLRIQAGKGVVVKQTEDGLVVESGTAADVAQGAAEDGQLAE